MRLVHLTITNFRGIKQLDWRVANSGLCLIGPGDSCKTTVLDGIELVLSPRWNVTFDDNDFYNADCSTPICIEATVGGLPAAFLSDAKFGLHLRGRSPDGILHDEPEEGDSGVMTICLRVDSSLEPEWRVVTDRTPEGVLISATDRSKLGVVRLGAFVDRHTRWGYGSALLQSTGEAEDVSLLLAQASRAARNAFDTNPIAHFQQVAQKVEELGITFGVSTPSKLRPRLDVDAVAVGTGGISLHEGAVPVRRRGLGSKRLLAIAIQQATAEADGLILIDEVESGLEPHRLRRLLRVLLRRDGPVTSQVIMTSHSPLAISELSAENLAVVRKTANDIHILTAEPELQPQIRSHPDAFLASRVIVCEGRTELGVCRALDEGWSENDGSFALRGIAITDGQGRRCTQAAAAFLRLQYPVALVVDSDDPSLESEIADLTNAGVVVVQWPGGYSLEQRVFYDLPLHALDDLLQIPVDEHGLTSIKDAIARAFETPTTTLSGDSPTNWIAPLSTNEETFRSMLGILSTKRKWFKRVDLGERLGALLLKHADELQSTPLGQQIAILRVWSQAT